MRPLSISESARKLFPIVTKRELIEINETDFTTVSGVILTKSDKDWVQKIEDLKYHLPIIVVIEEGNEEAKINLSKKKYSAVIDSSKKNIALYSKK